MKKIYQQPKTASQMVYAGLLCASPYAPIVPNPGTGTPF